MTLDVHICEDGTLGPQTLPPASRVLGLGGTLDTSRLKWDEAPPQACPGLRGGQTLEPRTLLVSQGPARLDPDIVLDDSLEAPATCQVAENKCPDV